MLNKSLSSKRKQVSKASQVIEKGIDRLTAQEALQKQLEAFIEDFDIASCEKQIEEHKIFEGYFNYRKKHRSKKMEITNHQNKIDLLTMNMIQIVNIVTQSIRVRSRRGKNTNSKLSRELATLSMIYN